MVAKAFEIGDLVWAQMKGYPHWPAKIVEPPPEKAKTPGKKSYHFVYFFGSKNYSWILEEKIVHHSEEMLETTAKKKYFGYQEGIEELISESKLSSKKPKSPLKMTNGEDFEKISPKRKIAKPVSKVVKPKDRPLVEEPVSQSKKTAKQLKIKPPKKRLSLNEADEDLFDSGNDSQSQNVSPAKQSKIKLPKKRPSLNVTDEDLFDSGNDSQSQNVSPAKQSKIKLPKKRPSLNVTDEDLFDLGNDSQPQNVSSAKQPNNKPPKKRHSLSATDDDLLGSRNISQSQNVRPAKQQKNKPPKKRCSLNETDEDLFDSEKANQSRNPEKQTKQQRSLSETDGNCPKATPPDSYSLLFASVLPNIGAEPLPDIVPSTPTTTENNSNNGIEDFFRSKAATVKIGFLGMGMMGRGMVKNLIASKHTVTIWNRTPEKCDDLVNFGAIKAETPADVIRASDITFSCLSDPHAVRTVVFGEYGILKGSEKCKRGEKGYVEMSSIDAETSQEIAEAITNAGLRYLEAPIIGSRSKAENGSICILGSGDRTLFNECESCFHAISNHAYYVSCDVGKSANINIITSMFLGTMYVALSEALSLTERVQLPQSDIIEILEMRGISCSTLLEKGKSILEKDFVPDTALKHQQKDINLALRLSDIHDQPMTVTTAANEVYKHAKLLGCADFDASAVYQGAKH